MSGTESSFDPEGVSIRYRPVFGKGLFNENPGLISRFALAASAKVKERHGDLRTFLASYEEKLTWPIVSGPGFCGATHLGSGKVFSALIAGQQIISNSDCLYVNPFHRVFAISDAPDMSVYSRKLLTFIGERVERGDSDLQATVEAADRQAASGDHAALVMISFLGEPREIPMLAVAVAGGDSYIFRGNRSSRRLTSVSRSSHFVGKSHGRHEPCRLDLTSGDFFLLASDGISDVRAGDERLEDALADSVDLDDLQGSVVRIMNKCNEIVIDNFRATETGNFKGLDNVSITLIYPEGMKPGTAGGTCLLGGSIASL